MSVEDIKRALLARKNELEEKLARLYTEKVADDQVQDPGDQALSLTMENVRLSYHDAEREEYNRIVKAIKRIDEGTYGICSDCEGTIAEKRLKLNPSVTRCLVCQEKFEEQEKEG